ncbi:MAG: restriction endonuclease subunit S [Planctomycetaceae bacterium]|nr:restriction endonuclease subunit S [Planctomycetaceae bacterium]
MAAESESQVVKWLGAIPPHWKCSRFQDIANVVRGSSPRPAGDLRLFKGKHTPWITVLEVTKDSSAYLTSTREFLTELGAQQSRRLEEGTLVLTNSGATLGVPKILKVSGCANDGIAAFLDISPEVDTKFLYYFLSSLTRVFREQIAPGLGQPNLNTDLIGTTELPLPPLGEQRKIARVLESVDEAIEATRAVIDQTRQLKTALLQDLLKTTDWPTRPLKEVCHKVTDGVHHAVRTVSEGIPFLYVSCVRDDKILWDDAASVTPDVYESISRGKEPMVGSILYTVVGSYGHAALVSDKRQFAFQRHIAFLVPDSAEIVPQFLVHWLNSHHGRLVADKVALGNAQKTITLGELSQFQVPVPTLEIQAQVAETIESLHATIDRNADVLAALNRTKSALSQGLLTGCIPVNGVA